MTTFPGTADTGLPKFTNMDDISPAKVAVLKTTPPSPVPPSTDVLVMEAPAAACAVTTRTTEMTMEDQ